MTYNILEIIWILYSFRLVSEGNTDIIESLRLEFSEKISVNNFALSNAEYINSGPLYRGIIASEKWWDSFVLSVYEV